MAKTTHISREINLDKLTNGAWDLLAAYYWQTWGRELPKCGTIHATLFDLLCSDDEIAIRLESMLSRTARMMTYGVEGLAYEHRERDENDKLTDRRGAGAGLGGAFIPSEKYVEGVVSAYDDIDDGRRWYIPRDITREVQAGRMTGEEALEAAAMALDHFCTAGKFRIAGRPGSDATFTAPASGVISAVTCIGVMEGDTLKMSITNTGDEPVKIDSVSLNLETGEASAAVGDLARRRKEAEAEMKRRGGFDADRKIPGRVVDPEFVRWATSNGGRVFRLRHPWFFLRRGTILVRDADGEYFVSMTDEVMMSAGMVDHCSFEAATVENHPDIFEELFAEDAGGEGKQ